MTDILPAPPQGNNIVPTPPSAEGGISFPMLILAGVVVTAGIYFVGEFDSRAGWMLSFLILLGVAFGYKEFGNQLTGILGGTPPNVTAPRGQLLPGQVGPLPVGPVPSGVESATV